MVKIDDILDKKNGFDQLADRLNWDCLTQELGPYYAEGLGWPGPYKADCGEWLVRQAKLGLSCR